MSGSAERDEDGPAPAPADEARTQTGLLDELLEVEPRTAPAADLVTGLGTRVGRFVAWPPGEAPKVDFDGNTRGPLTARSTIALQRAIVSQAIADGRGVLLCFEDGRPDAPIITGLLQPLDHDEDGDGDGDEDGREIEPESETVEASFPSDGELDTRVDGRRVEIEAADEIVLRCGEASIVLRRNGRVVIRGTYVETRSRGVNRIKGGSVEIN